MLILPFPRGPLPYGLKPGICVKYKKYKIYSYTKKGIWHLAIGVLVNFNFQKSKSHSFLWRQVFWSEWSVHGSELFIFFKFISFFVRRMLIFLIGDWVFCRVISSQQSTSLWPPISSPLPLSLRHLRFLCPEIRKVDF